MSVPRLGVGAMLAAEKRFVGRRRSPYTVSKMAQPNRSSSPVYGYRDLLVWQRAMDLVVEAYRLTAAFPRHEKYGLVQQVRRAVVSVPSNIAEGQGRDHLGDYLRQLSVANGSLMELETQVLIAGRMGYVAKEGEKRILAQCAEVGKMLSGLVRALKRRQRVTHLTPDT